MDSYYAWFIIFAVAAYLITTDQSIAKFVILMSKVAQLNWAKFIWWLKHDPANPLVKYLIWRRSMNLAKELQKEFEQRKKDV